MTQQPFSVLMAATLAAAGCTFDDVIDVIEAETTEENNVIPPGILAEHRERAQAVMAAGKPVNTAATRR